MNFLTHNIEAIQAIVTVQGQPAGAGNPSGPAAPGQASDAVAIVDGAPVQSENAAAQDPFGGNFFLILMLNQQITYFIAIPVLSILKFRASEDFLYLDQK